MAYSGCIMVEVVMGMGKLPTTQIEEIKLVHQNKLTVCIFCLSFVITVIVLSPIIVT